MYMPDFLRVSLYIAVGHTDISMNNFDNVLSTPLFRTAMSCDKSTVLYVSTLAVCLKQKKIFHMRIHFRKLPCGLNVLLSLTQHSRCSRGVPLTRWSVGNFGKSLRFVHKVSRFGSSV